MLRTLGITLIVVAGWGVAHADADIYRWKDAQGIYHYSDQWVPGSEVIKSSKLRPASNNDSDAARPSPVADKTESDPSDKPTAAQTQAAKQDVAKAREQQCKDAKDAYDKAIRARHIFKPG